MHVFRTPLREARRLLPHDGLVAVIPNRAAFVAQTSPEAVRQSFEIMGAREPLAAGLACHNIADAEVDEIAALTFEMQACHARRDLHERCRVNRVVHDAVLAASRNAVPDEMAHKIDLRIQNLRFRSNPDAGKRNAAIKERQQMVELPRARDGEGLARRMRAYLARKAEAILAMLPLTATRGRVPTTPPGSRVQRGGTGAAPPRRRRGTVCSGMSARAQSAARRSGASCRSWSPSVRSSCSSTAPRGSSPAAQR